MKRQPAEDAHATYHLTPADYFAATDPGAPYLPEQYEADGFIHCTDGIANVVETANRYYRDDRRDFVLLIIDPARVTAPIRYEDPARIYPHIFGVLNREAIAGVIAMPRADDGTFLIPRANDPA